MNEPESWMQRARSALSLAKTEFDPAIANEDLCYQAQQAVEKSFKAVLLCKRSAVPKTHDLAFLLREIAGYCEIPECIRAVVGLTQYAVMTCYPGDYNPVTEDEVSQSISRAEAAVQWCGRVLDEWNCLEGGMEGS